MLFRSIINYDSLAIIDDGSCEYETCAGCMDESACNFDSTATIPNDLCEYPEIFYDCMGNCINDSDSDGVCDELEVYGCTDPSASNYDEFATENDGSCVYCDLVVSIVELDYILCNGDSSATIEIFTENANNTTLFYEINGESVDGPIVSGLPAGDYTITVLDGPTCQAIANVVISEPEVIAVTADVVDISCFGFNDGEVSLMFSGGISENSTYYFNGIETAQGQYVDVPPGEYIAYVVDGNGCVSDEIAVSVTSPDELTLEAEVEDVLCNGGDTGEVELIAVGGEEDYSYSFDGSEFSAEYLFIGLTAGDYNASVMDANGCSFDMVVTVGEPESLSITLENVDNSITDMNNGNIDISVEGGVPDYVFVWVDENGEFMGDTEDLSDIPGGTYTVTVTDGNGCVASSPGIVVDEVDGIFELELMTFTLFPNPANESIVIKLNNSDHDAMLLINDARGRMLFEKRLEVGQLSINISVGDLASGVYSVRLHSNNGVGVKPLIIQR